MKKWMMILAVPVILVIGGIFMYRHFVTDRIMDGGGMENPFSSEIETEETSELVEFFWHQNAMSYDDCFKFQINAAGKDTPDPRLYCSYTDWETLERIEVGDECDSEACPPVPLECWKEMADFLRNAELPAYREPDPNLLDATDSKVQVTWREGSEEFTNNYDGTSAHDLLKLLQDIAVETYRKTKAETVACSVVSNLGNKRETFIFQALPESLKQRF